MKPHLLKIAFFLLLVNLFACKKDEPIACKYAIGVIKTKAWNEMNGTITVLEGIENLRKNYPSCGYVIESMWCDSLASNGQLIIGDTIQFYYRLPKPEEVPFRIEQGIAPPHFEFFISKALLH
ncbi:MAG: hypothetical protein Q8M15_13010 [Bacteroidota bacterium]|nr:hypothetical protein [Bacteroidota bacterium]